MNLFIDVIPNNSTDWLQLVITSLVAVASSFAGACAAFYLNKYNEEKLSYNKNIMELYKAKYIIDKIDKLNLSFKNFIENRQKPHAVCDWEKILPSDHDLYIPEIDFSNLSFLLDKKAPKDGEMI